MSSGDTPPARFTSPSSMNTSTKKYPGTPKSPMTNNNNSNSGNNPNTNTGNRNSQARQRLLSSKISAPRPINLPSLRREHAVGSDAPVASPATSHGWGSASSSPSLSQQQPEQKDTEPSLQPSDKKQDVEAVDKVNESSDMTTATTSPVLTPAASNTSTTTTTTTTRAWAVPTMTETKVPPSTDFPTAAEAASGDKKKYSLIDDKEYLKYATSDPNHTSWDEMVSEDLDDFSVDVVEFEDGTKVQVGSDASSVGSNTSAVVAPKATDSVSPSERFTDDYDRSYPPKQQYYQHHRNDNQHQHQHQQHHDHNDHQHQNHHNPNYKPYGFNPRYNANYNSRRLSTEGGNERRFSSASGTSDRWTHTASTTPLSARRDSMEPLHYGNRRPSYDRKHDNGSHPATTLLQQPRRLSDQSFRSDHSREEIGNSNILHIVSDPIITTDTREEITAAQKNLMLTAAERAKKRLEEQEAEFKAAAERAKQKADALAVKQVEVQEKKIWKKPAVDKAAVEASIGSAAKTTKPNLPSSRSMASAKPSFQPTTKASLPPKVPDTSKPWNLVAANKQASPQASTPSSPAATTAAAAAAVAAAAVNNEPKTSPSHKPSSTSPPAPTQILKKEPKPVTIMKKEPKPTLTDDKKEEKDGASKKPSTEDEKKWEKFVSIIKTEKTVPAKKDDTPGDWNSFADRLQETTAEQDAIAAANRERLIKQAEKDIQGEQQKNTNTTSEQPEQIVEVIDYDHEEWGAGPVALGLNRNGWIRDENVYNQQRGGRGGGNGGSRGGRNGSNRDTVISTSHIGRVGNNDNNRNRTTTSSNSTTDYWHRLDQQNEEKPVVVEILKKHEPETKIISKKIRLTNLLKESSSPIFPDFIDKLAAKKPANMSFMVDTEESDKEITMMGQTKTTIQAEEEAVSVATSATTTTSNSNSTTSSPPKSQQRKMNVNQHFPVLVYQYPNQSSTTTTSDKVDSPTPESLSADHPSPPQHRPVGVYLMPQQPYTTNHQYIVPYQEVGTGNVQPIYYPKLSWQHQQQQGQQQHSRPFNNNYNDYASPTTTTNASKHHRYPNSNNNDHNNNNNTGFYQNNGRGGSSYRKRGGGGRGGGGHALGAVQTWSSLIAGSEARGTGGGRGDYRQQHHYNSGYNNNRKYNKNDRDASLAVAVDGSTILPSSPLTTGAAVATAASASTTM